MRYTTTRPSANLIVNSSTSHSRAKSSPWSGPSSAVHFCFAIHRSVACCWTMSVALRKSPMTATAPGAHATGSRAPSSCRSACNYNLAVAQALTHVHPLARLAARNIRGLFPNATYQTILTEDFTPPASRRCATRTGQCSPPSATTATSPPNPRNGRPSCSRPPARRATRSARCGKPKATDTNAVTPKTCRRTARRRRLWAFHPGRTTTPRRRQNTPTFRSHGRRTEPAQPDVARS